MSNEYTHDFKECSCKSCFVDGGHEYLRRGFTEQGCFEELSIVISEEEKIKCPQCKRELKIECTSTLKVDLHGNKKKEIIGSCEHCLADYFWIEIIDKSGNKKIEEFRRHFCG